MLWTVMTIPKRYVRQMTKKTPIAPSLIQKINNLLNKLPSIKKYTLKKAKIG